MSLLEKLWKQRHEALINLGDEMWGVVMHPKTYHELALECCKDRVAYTENIISTPTTEYVFGLRIIPTYGVVPDTFTIVDEQLGKKIIGEPPTDCPRK